MHLSAVQCSVLQCSAVHACVVYCSTTRCDCYCLIDSEKTHLRCGGLSLLPALYTVHPTCHFILYISLYTLQSTFQTTLYSAFHMLQCDIHLTVHFKLYRALYTAVWVKVAQVNFSEMRFEVKRGLPSGFLYHTN